jgi:hypothetical protein
VNEAVEAAVGKTVHETVGEGSGVGVTVGSEQAARTNKSTSGGNFFMAGKRLSGMRSSKGAPWANGLWI